MFVNEIEFIKIKLIKKHQVRISKKKMAEFTL